MARLKSLEPAVRSLEPRVRFAPKLTDPFYLSPEWMALVRAIKVERGDRCQECGSTHRVAGDHVREIRDGGARLDPRNVRLRCASCHNRKTAKAAAARARS